MMADTQEAIPDFPLFDVSDVEAAMGADRERYYGPAGWDAAKGPGSEMSRRLRDTDKLAGNLFYGGGKLADFGYCVKPGLDAGKVHRAINALMRSWGVSHQQKMGTLALALHHWCEPVPAPVEQAAS